MQIGLLEQGHDFLHVEGSGPCHKGGTSAAGKLHDVEFGVDVAVGRGGCAHALPRNRGELAACHAVDAVVHDDGDKIDVAPAGVDEVVAANGSAVAVTKGHKHGHFRAGELEACGKGECTAVQGVHAVEVHVARDAGRTADP